MKDAEIRHRPAERTAVNQHGVQAFCLAAGSLTAEKMAARFIRGRGRALCDEYRVSH